MLYTYIYQFLFATQTVLLKLRTAIESVHNVRGQLDESDKWDVLTIELHGVRWQSEGYDKWDVLTIELHGLRWQNEGYDKWDVPTNELHGLRWQSEGYDKWDALTIEPYMDSDDRVKVTISEMF